MIGSAISVSRVISITITKAVIGACTTPEKYDTIPITATAATGVPGMSHATFCPSPAPTASEGEKMPPGIPLA